MTCPQYSPERRTARTQTGAAQQGLSNQWIHRYSDARIWIDSRLEAMDRERFDAELLLPGPHEYTIAET
jgi:hypothetical protein